MTQKDNVKQLIGKSLNAYNNKVLQQIDRIEKKNKQQNHKISMLTNELDNDYLTKTEEGSVISLEHSKEGMVYIDSLEGNTLVNYCTDGSKELTLNGDIDLEGTFVTTTEGVDNGLVDVYCEGNTLVNLSGDWIKDVKFTIDDNNYATVQKVDTTNIWVRHKLIQPLKDATTYTIIVNIKENTFSTANTNEEFILANGYTIGTKVSIPYNSKGIIKKKFITSQSTASGWNSQSIETVFYNANYTGKIVFGDFILLEGDWTDREVPQHFIGMKSVGQDDENGHKIEILSQNKNLCTVSSYSGVCHNKIESNMPCKKNTVYTLTFKDESDLNQSGNRGITLITHKTKTDKNDHGNIYTYAMNEGGKEYTFRKSGFTFNTSDCCYISLTSNNMSSVPNLIIKEIQIEEGSQTSYSPQMFNKKEILLNEPLRGINDTIKDRFVKIGNKCFIERNCKVQTLNGSEGWRISDGGTQFICNQHRTDALGATNIPIICDKINVTTHQILDNGEGYGINLSYYLRINLRDCDAKNGATVEQFIQRLQANPVTIIYPLKTPIYEPLEINPELTCYNETTHISNNSLIPCNMKVKNSGYNVIIKPSTLYTVALDTNKSGTIGMNLGGAKGTTTNNVLTLTTTATLADDSLRLYGKGIKGSKVRLLEGDKTNWIPSYFEGMKSSFEDKFDATDNTYKMEILSNNKNVLNLSKHNGITTYTHHGVTFTYNDKTQEFTVNGTATQDLGYQPLLYSNDRFVTFEQGKQYTLSTTVPIPFTVQISERNVVSALTLNPNLMSKNVFDRLDVNYSSVKLNYFMLWGISAGDTFNNLKFKLQIEEGSVKTEYIPNKQNKIQFSSIEPLRGVDNTKDRFVFKDNKLMIERNCGYRRLDGTENWTKFNTNTKTVTQFYTDNSKQKHGTMVGTCTTVPWIGGRNANQEKEGLAGSGGAGVYLWLDVFNYKLESLDSNGIKNWLRKNNIDVVFELAEPTYEEIPYELQKIILEGYENGTLFFDTNIPPTATVRYAGETPIVNVIKSNKSNIISNTQDINDNIIPYLMDMDYRVVCLELATETQGISMARLFGGTYEMLQRDILSKRYSVEEYKYRLDAYLSVNKITEKEYEELGEMLNE